MPGVGTWKLTPLDLDVMHRCNLLIELRTHAGQPRWCRPPSEVVLTP